jgi:hypothetical protein
MEVEVAQSELAPPESGAAAPATDKESEPAPTAELEEVSDE